ncbi:hypothetical protein ACHRVZ_13985 [Flavobacterium sp. FlaQc-57]|uniref:hypothetical protein n=1 Tax=Flavobacterium sp. FlaQc-57 TaxID=3374186 RepID=UPI003756D6F6
MSSLKHIIYRLKVSAKKVKDFLFPFVYTNYNSDKWIYISYLTEPFRRKDNLVFLNGHQNRREILVLSNILNDLKISYDITDHNCFLKNKKNYDFIFGIEPGFEKASLKNKSALKIYYATGAYYTHQNNEVIRKTDHFKKKWNVKYPYYRLVKKHNSCEIADYIIQIGSKFTVETYPEHLRKKIFLVNQSTPEIFKFNLEDKIKNTSRDNYIWLGGGGTLLKGLDLVFDYFFQNKNLKLHVVGDIDFEFMEIYRDKIIASENIYLYGFQNIDDEKFYNIVKECCFIIYPSSSEGGAPGSVLTLQKYGLIPIVSKYASMDDINSLGFQIPTIDMSGIKMGINWSLGLNNNEIEKLMLQNYEYVTANFTLEGYKTAMSSLFNKLLS